MGAVRARCVLDCVTLVEILRYLLLLTRGLEALDDAGGWRPRKESQKLKPYRICRNQSLGDPLLMCDMHVYDVTNVTDYRHAARITPTSTEADSNRSWSLSWNNDSESEPEIEFGQHRSCSRPNHSEL